MIRPSPLVSPANHRLTFHYPCPLSLSYEFHASNFPTITRSQQRPLAITVASGAFSSPSLPSPINSKRSDQSDGFEEFLDVGVTERSGEEAVRDSNGPGNLGKMTVGVGNPSLIGRIGLFKMSLGDQAFFLMAFIAITTTVAFTSLVAAAIPTLFAMKRAAISLAKLADIAREELPSTMAAVRLSGMEISDLTLELSDLSQDISEGVNKSAQAVRAAEAGIKQMGAIAHQKTMSIIEERANLPDISFQPFVTGAAKKTSRAVGKATKNFIHFLSGESESSEREKPNIGSIDT